MEVNPSPFPFPRFGAPLLGTGPRFPPRLGAVALSRARGTGKLPELSEGGPWQREGRSPAFLSGKEKKRAFSCELWPRSGAAVDFGQPLGPRRRQRGALWRSRAAGDAAVRCPERPSLPAAESRVWKGAELMLTAGWKAVLLWGNNPSLVALIQRTLKHRPWWTARENWEEHYEAELRLRALLTAEAALVLPPCPDGVTYTQRAVWSPRELSASFESVQCIFPATEDDAVMVLTV